MAITLKHTAWDSITKSHTTSTLTNLNGIDTDIKELCKISDHITGMDGFSEQPSTLGIIKGLRSITIVRQCNKQILIDHFEEI